MRISELSLSIFDDLSSYAFVYLLFLIAYLLLYKKFYWSIFDPMVLSVVNMVGGAFCVWFLNRSGSLRPFYLNSFISTELALFLGFCLAGFIPIIKAGNNSKRIESSSPGHLNEFDIFLAVVSVFTVIAEIISVLTVGIVLFDTDANHVSAFDDHGILRAFLHSFRTLTIIALYYKKFVLKSSWSLMDILVASISALGILSSGSKSSILIFVFMYFMVTFPLVQRGEQKKMKLSFTTIALILSFPVGIIMISVGANTFSAVQQLMIRFVASGDVFLLGFNDEVMGSISETSFFRYAFYPGWGSVLKNLGFSIKPPTVIGSDIYMYYSGGETGGGPNARHNYLGLHFFGFAGSIVYSFLIGLLVSYFRNVFKHIDPHKASYLRYLFFVVIASNASTLIDDINVFMNQVFWTGFFLTISVVSTKTIFYILTLLFSNEAKTTSADSGLVA